MPFINFNSRNILFVHIPRTGGTTTEKWLARHGELHMFTHGFPMSMKVTPQHLTSNDLRSLFGDNFFDYSFTIVRNPFDRIASEYRMRYAIGKSGFFKGFEPFHAWLELALHNTRSNLLHLDNHIRPQSHFLAEKTKVFKYEMGLEKIFKSVSIEAGLPENLEGMEANLSTSSFDGAITWNFREIELVREFYRRDFELFGYDMDLVPESNDIYTGNA